MAGIGVLAAGSWISVPFYPVPLTMQTLAVMLVGGLLGPQLGISAVTAYLVMGAMGAPVFHNGFGGLALLAGPTGGYLVGFLPGAFLMGLLARQAHHAHADRKRRQTLVMLASLAVGTVLANLAIYGVGVPWLALYTGGGLGQAMAAGVTPFVLGELLKMPVAVGTILLGGASLARRGLLRF
ncbi:MAG: biotin transporter BioY [Actinobacteria bacterium]|nr:biotin transporter BioY [Actinomycetota bacterium]